MRFLRHAHRGFSSSGAPVEGLPPAPPPRRLRALLTILLVVVILIAALALLVPGLYGQILTAATGSTGASQSSTSTSSVPLAYQPALPVVAGGSANVTFPQDYPQLADFAVSSINTDRATFGIPPVSLENNSVSQQHADSMFYFGYFSHWDTQGYKPYMRFTLLGGRGAVEENIAYISWESPHYFDLSSIEGGLQDLEHMMVYNDSVCCQNGHKDNILNGLHDMVSIGIAYNSTRLYYVQDFESYYLNLNFSVSRSDQVTLAGQPLNSTLNLREVAVFYDPPPAAETTMELNDGPGAYTAGTLLGLVFPPCNFPNLGCPTSEGGITVYANTWINTTKSDEISFQLTPFTQVNSTAAGLPGVYTLYLLIGDDTDSAITSISIFVASPAGG